MKRVIAFFILVGITIMLNISLGKGKRYEFDAQDLPSALTEGEKKVVNTGIAGNLTFGPYILLEKGSYELQIFYNTDNNLNTWDVFSNSTQLTFASGVLSADKTVVSDNFYLEDVFEDIEIRTYYQGTGKLEIVKIVLIEKNDTMRMMINLLFLLLSILLFTMKKKSYQECVVIFFVGVLLCPLLCTVAQNVFDRSTDIELKGNFEEYTIPDFDVEGFYSGEYQEKYELWWNNSFSPRGVLIKTYNQFRYSMFGLSNRIVGEKGDIFEENYLTEALCLDAERDFSIEENKTELQAYYGTLVRLQKKLEERGKVLLVYTTPNKAAVHDANIPGAYKLFQDDEKLRAIDLWREYTEDGELNYVDMARYLQDTEYPVFYLSGIHWTRPAEQEASVLLVRKLNEKLTQPLNELVLGEMIQSEEPFWRDTDVYDLLNIYRGKKDDYYYEYETEESTEDSPLRILMQGDSFALGFRQDFKQNHLGASIVNIFYNEYVIEEDDAYVPIASWETFDFGKYVDEADAVIIEMNEALMYTYNRGFAEALEAWLDQNPQEAGKNVSQPEPNIDFSVKKDYSNNLIRGYYHAEDGFCWMAENSLAVIQNEKIFEQGLQIELVVPKELKNADEVEVSVHGAITKKCKAEVGVHTIVFAPEELPEGAAVVEVEVTCDSMFNPKEQGISVDDRDLSLQIKYIGECR